MDIWIEYVDMGRGIEKILPVNTETEVWNSNVFNTNIEQVFLSKLKIKSKSFITKLDNIVDQ